MPKSPFAKLLLTALATLATVYSLSQTPAPLPKVTEALPQITFPALREVSRDDDIVESTVSFPSPVTSPYPQNDHIDLRLFMPDGVSGPIPTVLILHYWGATDLRVERALAVELAHRNIGSAIMTLPYHLGRTPPGSHSGELAIEPNPDRLLATMTQSVLDVRRSLDFLSTLPDVDRNKLGIAGTSLGSIVAATSYGVDARIKHSAFLLGGADLAHILWTSSRVVTQREILRRKGFTEDKLRIALNPVEPLNFLRDRRTGDSFVVSGQFDTVIPRESTDALISALPNAQVLWLDTGHYGGIFVQRRLMRLVAQYFETVFKGGSFTAPENLYAPTLRVGFKLDTRFGVDLGGGIDLLKFDKTGDLFSTLFVTPRGPQLFLGRKIGEGASLGFSLTTKGFGFGLLWSTVL